MDGKKTVDWKDFERDPKCAPDPNYPDGKDVGFPPGLSGTCKVALPYPAKRCGVYLVRCSCGMRVACTTAGRADDPRSITIPCLEKPN